MINTSPYIVRPLASYDLEKLKMIMRGVEWPEHYVNAHADAAEKFIHDDECEIYGVMDQDEIMGFVSLKHQKINWLTCVFTLVVARVHHRKGIGKALVDFAEGRARARENRGIFLDTTDQNIPARAFYKAIGMQEAYVMPYYYTDELHGVTYMKLFNKFLEI